MSCATRSKRREAQEFEEMMQLPQNEVKINQTGNNKQTRHNWPNKPPARCH